MSVGAGNAEAEVGRIARDVPVLQAGVEPLLQLAGHVLVHVSGGMPVPQALLEGAQPEEEVLGVFLHRGRTGDHRARILQFGGRIGGTAALAAVAVLVGRAAHRALAAYEAVRQEHLRLGVIGLLDRALRRSGRALQAAVEEFDQFAVFFGVGRVVVVEVDIKAGEVALMLAAVVLHQRLGRNACVACLEHDRRAVRITRAHIGDLMATEAQVTHPDIRLHVLHQVPDVDRAVGVGQGAGDEDLSRRSQLSSFTSSNLRFSRAAS